MAFDRQLQLRPAIAAQAVENVARQALRMNPHQHRFRRLNIAHLQHHGVFRVVALHALEPQNAEVSEAAGKIGFGDFAELKGGWHGIQGVTHSIIMIARAQDRACSNST